MTTLSEAPTSDLILRVTGGPRDGELISVSTPKCYLGMESNNKAISKNPQCVIFRGREGAVVRSYAKQVMINDDAASLHWLQKGDAIQFPNAMKIEVVQLGELNTDAVPPTEHTEANSTEADNSLEESRLVMLESELRSIQVHNEQFDNRLNALTEQMTMLINLSNSHTGIQGGQTSELSTTSVTSASTATETPADQAEEKIINPLQNKSWNQSTTVEESATPQSSETESPVTEQPSSTEQPAVENTENNAGDQTQETEQVPTSQEVAQSPLTPSPLEELNRIDRAIEESVSGYYSHTDESDEQIMAFNGDSATSVEPETADNTTLETNNSTVIEEQIVSPTLTEAPASEQPTEQSDAQEAKELAEKQQRILDMERIFGGALAESEPDDQETKSEQSDPAESAQTESTESFQSVDTIQPADEQLVETFENITHGQNAEVDSSADNSDSADSKESIVSEQLQESDFNSASTPESDLEGTQELESHLSPMARQLLQDVKTEQVEEQSEVVEMPVMLPASERVGSQTVVFPPSKDEINQEDDEAQSVAQQSSATDSNETETESLESGLSPLAQQLLQDVKTEQAEEQSQNTEMPVMLPESERVESETVISPTEEGNESVADLLARMKEDGKWDGVPSEDAAVDPVKPVETEPVTEPAESFGSSADDDEEGEGDDVEDYMSQLLSRMRGEEPAVEAKAKKKKDNKKKQKPKADQKAEPPVFERPADPLKPEEFKPKRKAERPKTLDAMRELANSNTRTNVKTSQTELRKAQLIFQACVGAFGLIMSLGYFIYSKSFFDVPFLIGVVCLILGGICGFVFYQNLTKNKVSESAPKKANDSAETTEG